LQRRFGTVVFEAVEVAVKEVEPVLRNLERTAILDFLERRKYTVTPAQLSEALLLLAENAQLDYTDNRLRTLLNAVGGSLDRMHPGELIVVWTALSKLPVRSLALCEQLAAVTISNITLFNAGEIEATFRALASLNLRDEKLLEWLAAVTVSRLHLILLSL
jgi:hypothetical protein